MNTYPFESLSSGDEVRLSSLVQESKLNKSLNESRESLVSKSSTNDGLSFRNEVLLLEGGGVSVGVSDEGEGGGDEVGLGVSHQVLSVDFDELSLRIQSSRVEEGEENTAGRPREFVST